MNNRRINFLRRRIALSLPGDSEVDAINNETVYCSLTLCRGVYFRCVCEKLKGTGNVGSVYKTRDS